MNNTMQYKGYSAIVRYSAYLKSLLFTSLRAKRSNPVRLFARRLSVIYQFFLRTLIFALLNESIPSESQ